LEAPRRLTRRVERAFATPLKSSVDREKETLHELGMGRRAPGSFLFPAIGDNETGMAKRDAFGLGLDGLNDADVFDALPGADPVDK
jgi:hypothetical protein